ncbi:hypothetical protein CTAYLR_003620 [Chrysophaeum taylorii]|uniref:Borealin N-terminal domain-containing protein n=1 Tax=Chrysophaeum taylorii TaxID=2483200 RepID=A0AAD7UD21_9STRA|nr:hypothetical protein CTAYLR_003620 [Chrysophaeum taylorii]
MPPRKARKRRGKELVEAHASALGDNTTTEPSADDRISPDYVETVISELEHENERRIKKLKRAMGDLRQEFLNNFHVELLKIPRKVREMKVEHFSREFGGSIDEALKKAAAFEVAKTAPSKIFAKTPGGAATSSRAPRLGEAIMSVNGSPLVPVPSSTTKLSATIKVKGSRPRLQKDTNLLVELPTGDGCVSLSEPDTLKVLTDAPELKQYTLSQLQSLQTDIANVMKTLQG